MLDVQVEVEEVREQHQQKLTTVLTAMHEALAASGNGALVPADGLGPLRATRVKRSGSSDSTDSPSPPAKRRNRGFLPPAFDDLSSDSDGDDTGDDAQATATLVAAVRGPAGAGGGCKRRASRFARRSCWAAARRSRGGGAAGRGGVWVCGRPHPGLPRRGGTGDGAQRHYGCHGHGDRQEQCRQSDDHRRGPRAPGFGFWTACQRGWRYPPGLDGPVSNRAAGCRCRRVSGSRLGCSCRLCTWRTAGQQRGRVKRDDRCVRCRTKCGD